MKSNPSTLAKRAAAVGLLAVGGILAASAYAVSAERGGDTPRCEARHGPDARTAWTAKRSARLAALKEKLKLAPGQEAAWNAYVASTQPATHHHAVDRQAMRGQWEKLSTPERLDRMQAMADRRRAQLAERAAATRAFYAQLNAEQQHVFDAETLHLRARDHRFGHQMS
ncbi:Spy/CpxP family protein refolding chaperone [Thiobacillus sedimenti]|uniref:Spy/CpxP family protein refolding chaperone n=1 Tax=Thiobacillus sedimenti TaxID=3110231 RepID=A0ABZ1CGF9_9PROT|nr:Spy/CpxP family protein refolding chaperone [Thiobacillus sp. SCUT-2]WRS38473.1 Spy/CpxP family protein refolding chaperone [Thiobacillus sp. SCUT-2]